MRVAIYTGIINSGVRTNIEDLLRRGHSVDVVFEAPSKEAYRPQLDEDSLARLRWFSAPPLPLSRKGRAFQALQLTARGIARHPRPFLRVLLDSDIRPHHSLTTGYCLGRVTSALPSGTNEYDIIHAHSAVAGRRAAILMEEGVLSGKLVLSFKGMDVVPVLHRADFERYRHLFDAVSAATVQTEFMRDTVIRLGMAPEKLTKIPSSVHAERIPRKPLASMPPERTRLRLITVARFIELKGHRIALSAIRKLLDQGYDVEYTLVGSGPLERSLREQVAALQLEDVVVFAGRVPLESVYASLAEHDVLLMPGIVDSSGACEAMGLVSLEAQLVGLPVIVSDVGGLPETVSPDGSGIVVPSGDVDELCKAIARLYEDRQSWGTMVEAGRRHVLDRYAIERTGEHYMQLYSEVLDGGAISQRWES